MPEVKKTVNTKSTKDAIWAAYNEALAQLSGAPVEMKTAAEDAGPSPLKDLAELKMAISHKLDEMADGLSNGIDKARETENRLGKEKTRMVEELQKLKGAAEEEIKHVKAEWEEAKKARDLERKREEDEFQYALKQNRRKEQDEYEVKRIKIEAELKERETAIKTRDEAVAAAEKEVGNVPGTIASAVEAAKQALGKELTDKFTSEIKDLKVAAEHEGKIASINTANKESIIKTQAAEIENLKRQLENATKQMKEMAISVVEGRSAASRQVVVPEAQK